MRFEAKGGHIGNAHYTKVMVAMTDVVELHQMDGGGGGGGGGASFCSLAHQYCVWHDIQCEAAFQVLPAA